WKRYRGIARNFVLLRAIPHREDNVTAEMVEKCRAMAELCRRHAGDANSPERSAHWLELADGWLALAEDRLESRPGRRNTAPVAETAPGSRTIYRKRYRA